MTTNEQALTAFDNYDSSVFLGWLEAVGDVMMCRGDTTAMSRHTMPQIGGLILAMSTAAAQLAEQERKS